MSTAETEVFTVYLTLLDENNNIIDDTFSEKPISFLSGYNQFLPKLEQIISEMKPKEKNSIVLEPADAFGEYLTDKVDTLKRSDFPEDSELKIGMDFIAENGNKKTPFYIKEIKDDEILIDYNHPLAGKRITFQVEMLSKRKATADEIAHGHVHGSGGHEH